MRLLSRTLVGASVLAVSQALSLTAATAQETAPDESAQVSNPGEIIVTAQRRSERLQDVPISIAVVGGADLAANEITNFNDLAPRIPNFSITRSPAGRAITMRGVGSSSSTPSLEQSVVTFVDGIYGGNNRQFGSSFLDVERVEVLRGPQGALVGKNTVAGALNVLTRRPTDELGGYLDANYDFLLDGPSFEGAINVPLGSGFAMRVAGRYTNVDGFIRNVATNRDEPTQEEFVGRVSVSYDTGGKVTAFLKYEHSESDGVGTIIQLWSPRTPGYELDYRKNAFASDGPETVVFNTDNLVAQFDFDLDFATLTSITGYSGFKSREHLDADFTPAAGGIAQFDLDLDQFSQEFRLVSSGGGDFDYAAGALFQIADLSDGGDLAVLPLPVRNSASSMEQTTKDISIYGQAGYNFGPFRVQGSLRYTNVRKDATYQRIMGPLALQGIGALVRNFDASIENNLWDPSLVLQYRPSSDVMIYASYQHGSKSGGFQGAISNAEQFSFIINPERATSFEAGVKLGLGGGSYFNLAGFHTTYDDLQVSTAILGPDGLSAPFFVGNAGTARVVGLEFDSVVRISPEFDIAINGAWNPEAQYRSFRSGPCPDDGVFAPRGVNPGSCDLSGLRLPFSPRFQGTVTANFKAPITDDLSFTASATALYRSEARLSANLGDFFYFQDEFVKIDARIALGATDGGWEFGLVGRNLTDRLTRQNVGAGGFARTALNAPDAHSVTVAPPRQILLTASFKY